MYIRKYQCIAVDFSHRKVESHFLQAFAEYLWWARFCGKSWYFKSTAPLWGKLHKQKDWHISIVLWGRKEKHSRGLRSVKMGISGERKMLRQPWEMSTLCAEYIVYYSPNNLVTFELPLGYQILCHSLEFTSSVILWGIKSSNYLGIKLIPMTSQSNILFLKKYIVFREEVRGRKW